MTANGTDDRAAASKVSKAERRRPDTSVQWSVIWLFSRHELSHGEDLQSVA